MVPNTTHEKKYLSVLYLGETKLVVRDIKKAIVPAIKMLGVDKTKAC